MSRRRLAHVFMAGFLLPAAVLAQGTDAQVQQLMQDFNAAYQAKDYGKAIEIGEKLVEIDPGGRARHDYNLACCHALRGEGERALKDLTSAVEVGFSDYDLLVSDPDLASIREAPGYKDALEQVRKKAEAQLDEFRKHVEKNGVIRTVTPETLDRSKPAPLIVALHGANGTADYIIDQWRKAAAESGAILVAPQGVRFASTGYVWGNPREAEVIVLRALERAMKDHKIDEKRIVLTGFSQGGRMSVHIAMRKPKQFAGVIPVAGGLEPNFSPKIEGDPASYPAVYFMVGSEDQALPSNRAAAKALESAKVRCKLVEFEGVGHTFPTERDAELLKALRFALSD